MVSTWTSSCWPQFLVCEHPASSLSTKQINCWSGIDQLFAKNLLSFKRDAADFVRCLDQREFGVCVAPRALFYHQGAAFTLWGSISHIASAGVLAWPYTVRIFKSFSFFHTTPLAPPSLLLFPPLPGWTSGLESANTFLCTVNAVISKNSLEFEKKGKVSFIK